MPAQFTTLSPLLIVEQLEPTRAFFVDRLGFTVMTDVPHEGSIGFSRIRRGDVEVMIQSDASLREDLGESYIAGPFRASIYIRVDDVELIVPEVIDADVVLPLRKTAYGMHEIGIREPGGNIIVFASRLPV